MRRWLLSGCGLLVLVGLCGLTAPAVSGDPSPTMELLVTDCTEAAIPLANSSVVFQLYRQGAPLGNPVTRTTGGGGRVTYSPAKPIRIGDRCVVTIEPTGGAHEVEFTFGDFPGGDDLIIWWPSENPLNDPCEAGWCCTTGEPFGENSVIWHIRNPE